MIYILLHILLIAFIFPNTTESDTISILIPEVEIYGGLNESAGSINISIIKEDKFTHNGNKNFENLIQSIGNLHYAGGTSRAKYFQLRGLGELSQFSGEGAPHFYVGYMIDNIDFSGIGMIGMLEDVKQIEIFKGPQSSIYGPNAMAGMINVVSNNPTKDKSLNISTNLYSNNGQSYSLSSSIPITKRLFSRFTLFKNYTDGFIKNVSDINNPKFNTNAKKESLFRTKLIYNPNAKLLLTLTIYHIDLNNKYDVWSPDNNGFITFSDFQGYDKQKTNAFSINSKFNLTNSTLTSITAYSDNKMGYSYDGDWGNIIYWEQDPYNWYKDNLDYFSEDVCIQTYGYYPCYYDYDFTDKTQRNRFSFSQEFRIKNNLKNNIILTSGIYYSKTKESDIRDGWIFAGAATNIHSIFDILNYAFYTQIAYPITKNLLISTTLRFDINDTKQDLNYASNDENWNTVHYFYNNEITDNNLIGGSIKINYQHTKTLIFNTFLSRGYKTSGINQTQYEEFDEKFRIYRSETCNNIEFGLNYIKNKYNFKISTFYMHRDNPQLRLAHQYTSDPTSFDYATYNAETAYHYGTEADFIINFSKFFKISQSFSLLETYVSKFKYRGTSYGNRELSHSPNHKYTLGIYYDFSKYINGLKIDIQSSYISNFYFEEQNDEQSNSYNLIDISLEYKYKNLTAALWSKNITNEKYAIRGYKFVLDPISEEGKSYKSFGNLRTTGITLSFNIED